jgi:hypothetical protein
VPTEVLEKNFSQAAKIWGIKNADVIALSEEIELRAEEEEAKAKASTAPQAEAGGQTSESLIAKKQQMISEIENEREAEVLKRGKPDVKITFLSSQEMIASKDPVSVKLKQDELKEKYKEIKKAIDCLWS